MKYLFNAIFCLCFVGVLVVGALLFTGHAGQAIRFSSFVFVGLLFGVFLRLLPNE